MSEPGDGGKPLPASLSRSPRRDAVRGPSVHPLRDLRTGPGRLLYRAASLVGDEARISSRMSSRAESRAAPCCSAANAGRARRVREGEGEGEGVAAVSQPLAVGGLQARPSRVRCRTAEAHSRCYWPRPWRRGCDARCAEGEGVLKCGALT